MFKSDREVLQYQLTQHEPQRFVLTLVTVDEPAFQRARARALAELERVLGAGAIIDAISPSETSHVGQAESSER